MPVYVTTNHKYTFYKKVESAPNAANMNAYQSLLQQGFGFFENFNPKIQSPMDKLLAAIHALSFNDQVNLGNKVYQALNHDSDLYVADWNIYQGNHDRIISHLNNLYNIENIYYSPDPSKDVMCLITDFLTSHLPAENWYSWKISSNADLSDHAHVILYEPNGLLINPYQRMYDDGKTDFYGTNWDEYLTTILFGQIVQIYDCDEYENQIGYNVRYVKEPMSKSRNNASTDKFWDNYMYVIYHMKPKY